jgi:hypothetical protein
MHMDEYAPDKPGAFLIYPRHVPLEYYGRQSRDRSPNDVLQQDQLTNVAENHVNTTQVPQSTEVHPVVTETDDPNALSNIRAAPTDEPASKKGRMCFLGSRRIIHFTVAVISIILVVTISVPLSLRAPPKDRFSIIRSAVLSISSSKDLKNSSSPQARALRWLVYDDALNVSETDIPWLRQRYTMAVLYYSTGGDTSWTSSLHFLEPIHECMWWNGSYGLFCLPEKLLTTIELCRLISLFDLVKLCS